MHGSGESDVEQVAADLGALMIYLRGAALDSPLDAVAELDLSFSQARTLLALDRLGGSASVGGLAARLPLSQGATSRVVEGLARSGLVVRHEDPEDRRIKRVEMTAAGSDTVARFAEFRQAKTAALREFVSSLEPADQQLLGELLGRILSLEQIARESGR